MFYVPYKFRQQATFCTPKGPDLRWAPTIKTVIDGTEISIKVPRNKTVSGRSSESPRKSYTLNNLGFSWHRTNHLGWKSMGLIARWWDFNGPWFVGSLAGMEMHAWLIQAAEIGKGSYFNPRVFESVVADFLTFSYGNEVSQTDHTQDWFAPVNWQPLSNFPCLAVKFDVKENRTVAGDRMVRYLMMPLSDTYLLCITFPIERNLCYIRSSIEPEENKDDWINEEPMKDLADKIINSLQVVLSPKACDMQVKAVSDLHDSSLSKQFPPLKWI